MVQSRNSVVSARFGGRVNTAGNNDSTDQFNLLAPFNDFESENSKFSDKMTFGANYMSKKMTNSSIPEVNFTPNV